MGPYHIISVDPEYVRLWQDCTENTVSVNVIIKPLRANDKNNDKIVNEESRANNRRQPPKTTEELGK